MENGDKQIPLGALAHRIYTYNRKVEGCTCPFHFISGVISFSDVFNVSSPPPVLSEDRLLT